MARLEVRQPGWERDRASEGLPVLLLLLRRILGRDLSAMRLPPKCALHHTARDTAQPAKPAGRAA